MTLEDQREHAEKVIENINAVLEGRSSHDVLSYSIGGKLITKMPLADLLKIKNEYSAKLLRIKQQERRLAGKDQGRIIKAVF